MQGTAKKLKRLSFLIGMTLLAGCSSDTYLDEPTASDTSQPGICNSSRLTLGEAITRAEETLGKKGTRSDGLVSVDYVLRSDTEKLTRTTAELNDTLAFIINFPDETGFAIIAADKRVSNVLAYAPTGNFDKNVPIVKEAFLSHVASAIDQKCATTRTDPGIQDPPTPQTYTTIPTIIDIELSQRSPWDKYVIKEHPNCPVGCVPVAVANIISHCADSLNFGSKKYDFKTIVKLLEAGLPKFTQNRSIIRPGGGTIIINPINMNYQGAVDKIAYLLYDIGKPGNLNVTYHTYKEGGSGAYSIDAYNLIKRMGYEVSSFSICTNVGLYYLMTNNYIAYVEGGYTSQNKTVGHAWVIDGCQYPNVGGTTENYYDEVLFWCNWGWGGKDNGYYWGAVYSPETVGGAYKLNKVFGVKIKNTFKTR